MSAWEGVSYASQRHMQNTYTGLRVIEFDSSGKSFLSQEAQLGDHQLVKLFTY